MTHTGNRQPPTIGILAGMGPHSTAPFLELVLAECQRQYGATEDIDFPPIMLRSHPTPFYADRPTDHAAMAAAVRDGLQKLAASGVDFLAIACNTAHIYFDELAAAVDVPLLDIVRVTMDRLSPNARRVALVAARPTAESQLYQRRFRDAGLSVPELDWQDDVDALLMAVRANATPARFTELWSRVTRRAEAANADALVIACLDLSATVAHITTSVPVLDASRCLAEVVVAEWLRRHGHSSSPER